MIYKYAINTAVDKITDFMVNTLKVPQEELNFSYMKNEFSNLEASNLLPKSFNNEKTINELQNEINFQQTLAFDKIHNIENLLKKYEYKDKIDVFEKNNFNIKGRFYFDRETKELFNNIYNNISKTNPLISYDFLKECIIKTSENIKKALRTNTNMELNPLVYSLYHNENGSLLFNYNENNELENIGVINENSNEKIYITETNYRSNEKDNLFEMDFSKIIPIIKEQISVSNSKICSLAEEEKYRFVNNLNILNDKDKNQRIIFGIADLKDNNQTFEFKSTSIAFIDFNGNKNHIKNYVGWVLDNNKACFDLSEVSNEKFAQQNLKNIYTLSENLNFYISNNEGISNYIYNKKNENVLTINEIGKNIYKVNFIDLKTAQSIALYLEGNKIYENFYNNFQDNELNLKNFIKKTNEIFNNDEYCVNPQIFLKTFGNSKDEETKNFTSLILNDLSDNVYEKTEFYIDDKTLEIEDKSFKDNFDNSFYQIKKINDSIETKTTNKEISASLVKLKRNLKQYQKEIAESKKKTKNVTKDKEKIL